MPVRLNLDRLTPAPAAKSGVRLNLDAYNETPEVSADEGEGLGDLAGPAGVLGGAALVAGGLLAKNPGLAAKGVRGVLNLRQQLMLSGLAIPKTVLGNAGGAAIASVERRSMDPLRQLFSTRTAKDFVAQYRAGAPGHVQAAGTPTGKAMHGPGRVLGAMDEATKAALQRAGLSGDDVERLTFQTPLNKRYGKLGDALDSPAMRYLIPFRRTPFNTLYEGAMTMKPDNLRTMPEKAMLAGAGAVGAAHGVATADEQHPMSLGLGAAAANRYAMPYLIAAAGGRALAGGKDAESVAGEVLPISEYGLASGVTQPHKPFTNPAALRVLSRLLGGE